jgi:glycosyltransferase involved in cell wall biosynthesis
VVLFNASSHPAEKRPELARSAMQLAGKSCDLLRLVVLDGSIQPERVPIFLNAADCLLLTSPWEGSPNIVKEAVACNIPVVSVDVGDVREQLAGVNPSRIVSAVPEEIARGVLKIVSSPSRSNGCEKVKAISSDTVAQRILAVYRAALGAGSCEEIPHTYQIRRTV